MNTETPNESEKEPAGRTGLERIRAERRRQVEVEGWTLAHDRTHDDGALARAGRSYDWAAQTIIKTGRVCNMPPPGWPWELSAWKPSADPVRMWEKAGALYLAEAARQRQIPCQQGGFEEFDRLAAVCGEKIDIYLSRDSELRAQVVALVKAGDVYRAQASKDVYADVNAAWDAAKQGVQAPVDRFTDRAKAAQAPPATFTLTFRGGYGERFPLAQLAEILKGNDDLDDNLKADAWTWVRNNRCKHLVVFIDTRGDRMCRVYDRDDVALTLAQLRRQGGGA